MNLDETQAFFEAYRDAFNRLDGDAVAELWHTPSGIVHTRDGEAHATLTQWVEEAPMRANHRALCELYRSNGYHQADFEMVAHTPLGADGAFANVRWTLTRADGSVLQRFCTGYNLARTPQGPRVVLCTAYQENISEMKRNAAQ